MVVNLVLINSKVPSTKMLTILEQRFGSPFIITEFLKNVACVVEDLPSAQCK